MRHAPAPSVARLAIAAVLAVAAVGCSAGSEPDLSGPSIEIGPAVTAVTVTGERTWGPGRALVAAGATDGTRAVLTTTGVYAATPGQADEAAIDTFDEATQPSSAMAIADDGSRVVVATSSPSRISAYDLRGGQPVATHDLPGDVTVSAVELLDDGGVLAQTNSGPMLWRQPGAESPTLVTDATAAGTAAVVGGHVIVTPVTAADQLVVTDGDAVSTVDVDLGGATMLDAAGSPDGRLVAVSAATSDDTLDRDDVVVVLDATTFAPRGTIAIGGVADPATWTIANGAVAAATSSTVSIWSPDGTSITVAPSPVDSPITRVVAAGDRVLTVHSNGGIVTWGGESWEPTVLDPGGVAVTSATVSGDAASLTTVDIHGRITSWDIGSAQPTTTSTRFEAGESTAVSIESDGDKIAVSSSTGRVTILDPNLAPTWSFDAAEHGDRVDTVRFDPGTSRVATGLAERVGDLAFDDTVTLWDPARRASLFSTGGEDEEVSGCSFFRSRVDFTGDGALMATASHDFTISIVDTESQQVVQTLPPTGATILDLQFSPDDDLLVATSDDASVHVWRTSDWSEAASYASAMGGYQAIGILPDSATMAVVDLTGAISLHDVIDGSALMTFVDADYRSATLEVSDDGTLLAAPVADSGIGLWSTHTGRQLAVLTGHAAPVTDLAFSADGSLLLSSSLDGTIRAWSLDLTR